MAKLVLFACLLAAALCACATEVRSLTPAEAPLEAGDLDGDGQASVQFSYLPDDVGDDPLDWLEIRFEGQALPDESIPGRSLSSVGVTVSKSLPPGTGRFEFLRDGVSVAISAPITVAADRFNHVIVYGPREALEVVELAAKRERRRVNVANVRRDRQDIAIEWRDGGDRPLGAPLVVVPYGETFSRLPPAGATLIRVTAGEAELKLSIPCSPNFGLIAFEEPALDSEYPVLAPQLSDPDLDDEGASCFVERCDCESPFDP